VYFENALYFFCFLFYSANSITVGNKGKQAITAGFFKNLGNYQPSFKADQTINLAPGGTKKVVLPHGWEGRVQKLTGTPADPATWGEIKFDASFQGMTFCDISLIRGYNGAMMFSSQDNSLRTGFTNDLYGGAPTSTKTKDSKGHNVLKPTQPFTGGTNNQLVKYYRGKVSNGNAYLVPDDNASSHGTKDKTINLDIY
jgi:hypothetical protein